MQSTSRHHHRTGRIRAIQKWRRCATATKQVFQVAVAKRQGALVLCALDKEVGTDDDEDTEASRTIAGDKTEAN